MFIIEGCDGTFKTTVANKLSKKLKIPVVKGSSFELATGTNKQLYEHFKTLSKIRNVIFDRYIYSNRVYATLFPKYTILTNEQRSHIEDIIRNHAAIIYLKANPDIIIERIRIRGDKFINESQIDDILNMYNKAISDAILNKMKVFTYDTNKLSSDEIVKEILKIK